MRFRGGIEHSQPLSTESSELGIVVGTARHCRKLHDLAADHGVIAHCETRRRLYTHARLDRIVITKRKRSLEKTPHYRTLDRLPLGIEHFNDRIERRTKPARVHFQNQLFAF